MIKCCNIAVLFCLVFATAFGQVNTSPETLEKQIREGFELLDEQPGKAFRIAQSIEGKARKTNAHHAELSALIIQCIYHRGKNDFENMMAKAKLLSEKAKSYGATAYLVMAKRFLFEAYFFSGLPEKALVELEQGSELADGLKRRDSLNILSKGDLYVSFSNYHALKQDYTSQLKFLKLAGAEFELMPNRDYRRKLLNIHYANLAAAYNEINVLDSAKYYTKLSKSFQEGKGQGGANITNLWVLGNVAMKEKDYRAALSYFREAEKTEGYKNHLNIGNLYENSIACYNALKLPDSAKFYEQKRDSLRLSITENQNNALHKLLKEKEDGPKWYIYIFLFIFALILTLLFAVVRKNRILARQEKTSESFLETFSENKTRKHYTQLLQMLERGDPAFMSYFHEMFPEFSKKILAVNPQIVQSELEFCSLLKLKIPTKDIARYKFITPKTVQNKKYLIRKKLEIPTYMDIYQWFDVL